MRPNPRGPRRPYTTGNSTIDAQIRALTVTVDDELKRTLLAELMVSIYRLGQDRASTGDLKLLNAAVKELRYAFQVFRPYRHIRKVATFGSSRMLDDHPAYGLAKRFGKLMAQAGWMVITGAASGIMKAGHEGAGSDASFGLNIRLPFEQEANAVIAKDAKLVNCKYFFTRKLLFVKESHAIALFPGGFGTLDEGTEALTLLQTGKTEPRPVIFVETGRFWEPFLRFISERLEKEGMILPSDASIFQVARSAEEAVQQILQFYHVYHSMRYVDARISIRLQTVLAAPQVAQLNRQFRDIIASGEIVQGPALPEEADELELAKLPRLVFEFNRQSYGRLVQLIHRLNTLGHPTLPVPKKKSSPLP